MQPNASSLATQPNIRDGDSGIHRHTRKSYLIVLSSANQSSLSGSLACLRLIGLLIHHHPPIPHFRKTITHLLLPWFYSHWVTFQTPTHYQLWPTLKRPLILKQYPTSSQSLASNNLHNWL